MKSLFGLKNALALFALSFLLVACDDSSNGDSEDTNGDETSETDNGDSDSGSGDDSGDDSSNGDDNGSEDTPSSDATLSNLTITGGNLSPGFSSAETNYTLEVGPDNETVQVTATLNDDDAEITIDGETLTSGEASADISVAQGSNTVTVEVTAEDDNTTQTYTVQVTRPAPPEAAELSAQADSGSVILTWDDTGASQYNLTYATEPGCEPSQYSECDGGIRVTDITSPHTVDDLNNGESYWFSINSVVIDSAETSNEASARPANLVPNAGVNAIAQDADGNMYLGGDFTSFGVTTGRGVPISLDSGRAHGAYPLVQGNIRDVAADGNGGFYIVGAFDVVDGVYRRQVAHIRADGTLNEWLADARNGEVYSVAVVDDIIYLAGSFDQIGGEDRNRLAAVNADGSVLDWNPDVDGFNVYSLTVQDDIVYVGGDFSGVGGADRSNLAAINTAGTVLDWDPGVEGDTVNAVTVRDSTVYVGGEFSRVDNKDRNNLAAINTDDSGSVLDWNPDANKEVDTIAVSDSDVYVGGEFTEIDEQERKHLAALDPSDGSLKSWNPAPNDYVSTLTLANDKVYVGGDFTEMGAARREHVAAIETDSDGNAVISAWNPIFDRRVNALAVYEDTVYVGGEFRFLSTGGGSRQRLAAVDADGELLSWNPSADKAVEALILDDEMVYIGGDFTSVNGNDRQRLAAIDIEGTLSENWSPEVDDEVRALLIANDTLYVGGDFATVESEDRKRLAAFSLEGTLTDWDPSVENDDEWTAASIRALAMGDDVIYVGGWFSSINGSNSENRANLAAIDANTGSTPEITDWSADTDGDVDAIAVDNESIYIGGAFENVAGDSREGLAAVGTDGDLLGWNPAPELNSVDTLLVNNDIVYAGGSFQWLANGVSHQGILAFKADAEGTLIDWNPRIRDIVYAIQVVGNTVFVGGHIDSVGGQPDHNLVQLGLPGAEEDENGDGDNGDGDNGDGDNGDGDNGDTDNGNGDGDNGDGDNGNGDGDNGNGETVVDASVALSDLSSSVGSLSPTFDSNQTSYELEVGPGTEAIQITAVLNEDASSITINDDEMVSGEETAPIELSQGLNNLSIEVVSEDANTSQSYTIKVAREAVPADIDVSVSGRSVHITWDDTGAEQYNLVYATAPGCNPQNYSTQCENGTMETEITSPYQVTDLQEQQNYWFYLESVVEGVDAAVSDESGARPTVPTLNGSVSAIAHDAEGNTYLGGDITEFKTRIGRGIPVDIESGNISGAYQIFEQNVTGAISDGQGGFYVTGDFFTIGNEDRNNIAHLRADGTLGDWNPNPNGDVHSIKLVDDTIFIGGDFSEIGSDELQRSNLAAVDRDGTVLDWQFDANEPVESMAEDNGILYIGGRFTEVDGEPRKRSAAINIEDLSDSELTPWAPAISNTDDAAVRAFAISDDDTLYAAGNFNQVGGEERNNVVAITTDSEGQAEVSEWNPDVSGIAFMGSTAVNAMAVSGDTVYIGGNFAEVGGESSDFFAAINTDGEGELRDWNPEPNMIVKELLVVDDTLYAGGRFTEIGGQERRGVAAIEIEAGGNAAVTGWDVNIDNHVQALAESDGRLFVGGQFSRMDITPRNRLAAIDDQGALLDWAPQADATVHALEVADETVYAAGYFREINEEPSPRIAAINKDGELIDSWHPGDFEFQPSDDAPFVSTIELGADTLYLGGRFTHIGDNERNGLAAVSLNGDLTSWNPSANDTVNELRLFDNTLYVGGSFSEINDSPRQGLAIIEKSATLNEDWSPSFKGRVNAIARTENIIFVGGSFSEVDSSERSNFAAFNEDRELLDDYPAIGNEYIPTDSSVTGITVGEDWVFIGGSFFEVNGDRSREHLTAIKVDGTLVDRIDWSPRVNPGSVNALSLLNDTLLVGGSFDTVKGRASPNFAPLNLPRQSLQQ